MTRHEQAVTLLEKAAQDEGLVQAVLDSTRVADELVGFHLQQGVEKILKAVMAEHGIAFQRTHNLFQLVSLLSDAGRAVPQQFHGLCDLTPFAVGWRYDVPRTPLALDRRRTLRLVQDLRDWAESQIAPSR